MHGKKKSNYIKCLRIIFLDAHLLNPKKLFTLPAKSVCLSICLLSPQTTCVPLWNGEFWSETVFLIFDNFGGWGNFKFFVGIWVLRYFWIFTPLVHCLDSKRIGIETSCLMMMIMTQTIKTMPTTTLKKDDDDTDNEVFFSFSLNRPTGPIQSLSLNVRLCVPLFVLFKRVLLLSFTKFESPID